MKEQEEVSPSIIKVLSGRPSGGWTRKETNIFLDPAMMLLLELRDEDSILHDIFSVVLGMEPPYENLKELTKKLESVLEELKSDHKHVDTADWDFWRQGVLTRHKSKANQRVTRRSFDELLQQKQDLLFRSKLQIWVHQTFGPHVLLKLDLEFLPKDFFFRPALQDCLENIQKGTKPAFRMTSGLHYHPIQDSNDYVFGNEALTKDFQELLKKVMVQYGHANPNHFLSWQLGFLWTAPGATEQDPHVDYEHKSIKSFQKHQEKQHDKGGVLPWSFDMPLKSGGMKLNYYGTHDDVLYETPLVVQCKYRECILWRGDAIHGGGHVDLNGGGGFRLHGYVHMNSGGRAGMSNTILPVIDWHDSTRTKRYASYLTRSNGEPFPKGNDK